MHQAGRRIITNHYRGDKLLSTTTQVDFYQFDNQQIITVDYVFKKGDTYHVYCIYDTTSVKKDIEFGGGSYDEMCMNFVYYYPAL
jgi:dopamine beta-monooxygenase